MYSENPQRDPSNRMGLMNMRYIITYPTLLGIEFTACSVPSESRYHWATVAERVVIVVVVVVVIVWIVGFDGHAIV